MTTAFPLVRVVIFGFVGVAVTLFFCLQVETSAQQARRAAGGDPLRRCRPLTQ